VWRPQTLTFCEIPENWPIPATTEYEAKEFQALPQLAILLCMMTGVVLMALGLGWSKLPFL